MPVLVNEKIDALLETTSRSFYPTLKYLPKKTRGQIGLLYLLAQSPTPSLIQRSAKPRHSCATSRITTMSFKAGPPNFLISSRWQPFKPMNMKRSFSETSPWSLKD